MPNEEEVKGMGQVRALLGKLVARLRFGVPAAVALLAVAVVAHGWMSLQAAERATRTVDSFTVELARLNDAIPSMELEPINLLRGAIDLPPLLDTMMARAAGPRVESVPGSRRWRWYRDSTSSGSDLVRLEVDSWGQPVTLSKEMVIDALQGLLRQEISLFEDRFNVVPINAGEHNQEALLVDKVLGYTWVLDQSGTPVRFGKVDVEGLLQIQTPQSPLNDLVQSLVDQLPGGWVARRDTMSTRPPGRP